MSRDDIIKMAQQAGAQSSSHPEKWDVLEFQDPATERFFQLAFEAGRKAEQERCCAIVIGLAGSDNVAHRTVKAIRSDK